jgi:DNA-binding protein
MVIKKSKDFKKKSLNVINKLLPKFDQVVVEGKPNTASNAIAVANYISRNYHLPVYYIVFHGQGDDPTDLLLP